MTKAVFGCVAFVGRAFQARRRPGPDQPPPEATAVRPSVAKAERAALRSCENGSARSRWGAALLAALALLAGTAQVAVQQPADGPRTRAHVEALASDRFEGRLAGSEAQRLAGAYLAAELQKVGVKPLPGRRDLEEPFEFTAGTKDGGSTVQVSGPKASQFTGPAEVRALSFSENGDVSGPVVFAGYGLVVPETAAFAYDSYAGLDVTDKVVLVLRYFPEDADAKTRAVLTRYADLRYKAMAARQHGAKAMVVVTGPRSPNAGEVVPMSFDTALSGSGIVAASVSGRVADAIFGGLEGKTIEQVQKALDDANPHVIGFDIPGVTVSIRAIVEREKRTDRNIVGYLPADGPTAGIDKPWIAIGAHYDHLGRGDHGSSLARKDEKGRVHYGADDNASGVSAVIALAATLGREKRHRNILVALWSGEELGLIGSNAFIASPPVPIGQINAYLNFDMVGRMQDNKLTVQALGSSPVWNRIIEQVNVIAGFDLQMQPDPYQPTDVSAFNSAGVPCLSFFTGNHADYHRPTDTADKIAYPDLERIVDFAAGIVRRVDQLEQAPPFVKVEPQARPGGRDGIRITTGTIPDYSTDAKGLLLSGVVGGGPADQIGLQKGDIIVEIAGQSITNIYDYTFALELLKIGDPVKIVYLRNGERKDALLTPAARK